MYTAKQAQKDTPPKSFLDDDTIWHRLEQLHGLGMKWTSAGRYLGLRNYQILKLLNARGVAYDNNGGKQTREEQEYFFQVKEVMPQLLLLFVDKRYIHTYGEDAKIFRRLYGINYRYDSQTPGLPKCVVERDRIRLESLTDELVKRNMPYQVIQTEESTRRLLP